MLGGIVNERFLNNKERSELEATSSCVVSRLDVVGLVQDLERRGSLCLRSEVDTSFTDPFDEPLVDATGDPIINDAV